MSEIQGAEYWKHEWEQLQGLTTIELRDFDAEHGGDEIVANNASVHLERMNDSNYHLGIETATEYVMVHIMSVSGRAKITAVAYEGGLI